MQPTPEEVAAYRRDGFLVVERFLDHDEVDRLRERFAACFGHEWETGLRPDEVNYDPASTPPDLTRQLCNAWKSDRTVARRSWPSATPRSAPPGRRPRPAPAQDNPIWKPPSGKALLCHQDAAYLDHLDPPNMTTCWMALDDTRADTGTIYYVQGSNRWPHAPLGGEFHAPDDWLGHGRASMPAAPSSSSCRSRCPPAERRSTTAGPSTARRRTSAPTAAARDGEPHDLDRYALEPGAPARRLLDVPPARRARSRRGVLPGHVARGRLPDAVDRHGVRAPPDRGVTATPPRAPGPARTRRRSSARSACR